MRLKARVRSCRKDEGNGLVYRAFTWEIDRELGSGNGPFDLAKELVSKPIEAQQARERKIVVMGHSGRVEKEIEMPLWLFQKTKDGKLSIFAR